MVGPPLPFLFRQHALGINLIKEFLGESLAGAGGNYFELYLLCKTWPPMRPRARNSSRSSVTVMNRPGDWEH